MTSNFGTGHGQHGNWPPTPGMGSSPLCPSCGVQSGYPQMGMSPFMSGMPMGGPQMGYPPMGYPQMGMQPFMGGMPMGYPQMAMPPFIGGMPWMGGAQPGFFGAGPGYQGFAPGYGPTYETMTIPDDEQIREMIFDSIDADPLVPYEADIEVDVTGGLVTLTGTVPNKRIKHAVGDDAWWIPGVWDVNNQLQVAGRARAERKTTRKTTAGTTTTTSAKKKSPKEHA